MSTTTTIYVSGMTCGHCAGSVKAELGALAGVTDVDVDLRQGEVSPVTITSDTALDPDAVARAVDEAGYAVADRG